MGILSSRQEPIIENKIHYTRAKITYISDDSDTILIHCEPDLGSFWGVVQLRKNHPEFDNLYDQLQIGTECDFRIIHEGHRPHVFEYSTYVVDIRNCDSITKNI
jgi:hypothetical protein